MIYRLTIMSLFFISCSIISYAQINSNLFGFCTSNSFTYVNTYDTSFLSKVESISPKVLRFPGGTIGNFYHPKGEAYGFRVADVEKYYKGRFSNRVHTLINAAKQKEHVTDYIEDFIILAKRYNSKVIVNANILSSDKDEIIYILNRFKNKGVEVIGVELGSELSNRAYKKHIKSVFDYIQIAKSYSLHIKSVFPDMKVGVVAAPIKDKIPNRIRNWNIILSQENFYDAIIHHSYHKVVDGEEDAGVMISEDDVKNSRDEQFNLYKDRILEELSYGFLNRMSQYTSIFKDKEIWITEWNLQMTKTTGNTMFQSLFVAHYLLELLSNPNLPSITIATYHNLAGRDVSASIFKGVKDGFEIHSTYVPLKYIRDIFEYDISKIEKKVIDNVFTYNCFNKNGNLIVSYVLDWNQYQIQYKNYLSDYSFNNIVFYSENLYDLANKNGILQLKKSKIIE